MTASNAIAIAFRSKSARKSPAVCTRVNSSAVLASVAPLVILALMALDVITASTALALGLAADPLAIDLLAWRVVAAIFDRERLVTGRPE